MVFYTGLKCRRQDQKDTLSSSTASVKAIINQVKMDGDRALVELAQKFDKAELELRGLRVKPRELKKG